ncbi:GNAT family N-acetyltransferase [Gilvimarinus xylanilyticus]|uniref:GNAT family N-acetyltransferase n=1 Tax=Gilvimarinus xylanilyticus TaxID=2944139 RepID=A0A9X2I5E7_9GAMM|nr:GNAT family N-acetyltransferase [Gilvimarinus xylanilyticus]MCP8900680.1 GNAT family N-acetyltransferase [Gilvimarinus xylanilyticus]
MKLINAKDERCWQYASKILTQVVLSLQKKSRPLWTQRQVTVAALKESYQLAELFFLVVDNATVGVVFIQKTDPDFWPEITAMDTWFVHKLAILPANQGAGIGNLAMECIERVAKNNNIRWLRLDCDDRPELHRFYRQLGFEFVDIKDMKAFKVARYQKMV